jgi:hypothetical protein
VTVLHEQPAVSSPPTTGASNRDGTLTDLEAAKLLLDAWKFRQAHAWSSLTRYFFAAVLVSVIPYVLRDDLARRLSGVLIALPILGGLLALAAVWLYAAEYVRAQSMNRQFRAILRNYGHYAGVDLRRFERFVLTPRIGWTTVYVLALSTIVLSGVNFVIVWSLVKLL